MQVHILDEALEPVPVGVPGEIYVTGTGLARGYLNRPQLTAERFIPNPFSEVPGARLYRTFDLGRRLTNGNMEFIGRADNQIKIRGYRIELGEIESALVQVPELKEAVVMVTEETPGDKRLVAFVVPESSSSLKLAAIKDHLRQRLPDYMVPSVFVPMESLPLTPNGKLDRQALVAARQHELTDEESFVAPRNETEERLCNIWADVLRRDVVGINDNFFEAGGHSLLATQLVTRIRQAFDIELPLRSVFEAPTVAAMCIKVVERQLEGLDGANLEELLGSLEMLSETEAKQLLATD
jgi:acyl carrier protein